LIEAKLMGIHSIGVDASPFCRFMAQAKLDGLRVPLGPVREALAKSKGVFEYFRALAGQPRQGSKMRFESNSGDLFSESERTKVASSSPNGTLPEGCEHREVNNFLLLAYLDSAGYS